MTRVPLLLWVMACAPSPHHAPPLIDTGAGTFGTAVDEFSIAEPLLLSAQADPATIEVELFGPDVRREARYRHASGRIALLSDPGDDVTTVRVTYQVASDDR